MTDAEYEAVCTTGALPEWCDPLVASTDEEDGLGD